MGGENHRFCNATRHVAGKRIKGKGGGGESNQRSWNYIHPWESLQILKLYKTLLTLCKISCDLTGCFQLITTDSVVQAVTTTRNLRLIGRLFPPGGHISYLYASFTEVRGRDETGINIFSAATYYVAM